MRETRRDARHYVLQDGVRVLGARVVAGHHGEVGISRHRRRHLRSLGAVAVATAAEDGNDPLGLQRAHAAEKLRQSIRGVRVIHDDVEAKIVGDGFKTASYWRHPGQFLFEIGVGGAARHPGGNGTGKVLAVEDSTHSRPYSE